MSVNSKCTYRNKNWINLIFMRCGHLTTNFFFIIYCNNPSKVRHPHIKNITSLQTLSTEIYILAHFFYLVEWTKSVQAFSESRKNEWLEIWALAVIKFLVKCDRSWYCRFHQQSWLFSVRYFYFPLPPQVKSHLEGAHFGYTRIMVDILCEI